MERALEVVDRLIRVSEREMVAARTIHDPLLALRYEMTLVVLHMVRDELSSEMSR